MTALAFLNYIFSGKFMEWYFSSHSRWEKLGVYCTQKTDLRKIVIKKRQTRTAIKKEADQSMIQPLSF